MPRSRVSPWLSPAAAGSVATLVELVRSVAVERVRSRVGQLPAALLAELDQALRVHLSL